jgi:hypothetical protein
MSPFLAQSASSPQRSDESAIRENPTPAQRGALGTSLPDALAHPIRVPPYGHVRHSEHVADLLERPAGPPHLRRVSALGRAELRSAAHPHAGCHGPDPSLGRPGPDQLALELGEPSEDRQDQSTVGRRRVGPRVRQRFEGGPGLGTLPDCYRWSERKARRLQGVAR